MNAKNKNETLQAARGKSLLAANDNTPARSANGFEMATIVTSKELLRQFPIGCRKTLYNHCKRGLIPSIVFKGCRKRYFHVKSVEEAFLRFQKGGIQ